MAPVFPRVPRVPRVPMLSAPTNRRKAASNRLPPKRAVSQTSRRHSLGLRPAGRDPVGCLGGPGAPLGLIFRHAGARYRVSVPAWGCIGPGSLGGAPAVQAQPKGSISCPFAGVAVSERAQRRAASGAGAPSRGLRWHRAWTPSGSTAPEWANGRPFGRPARAFRQLWHHEAKALTGADRAVPSGSGRPPPGPRLCPSGVQLRPFPGPGPAVATEAARGRSTPEPSALQCSVGTRVLR